MLEETSWIATIVGAILTLIGLFIAGMGIINRSQTRQNAKILGRNNTVNQSVKIDNNK